MERVELTGGRSTPGVYRIGDVVHRPHSPASEFYAPFLKYLEAKGLELTHRLIGVENGEDLFTFIEGYVPEEIGETTEDQLCDFMRIVKTLHDESSDYLMDSSKVVCHNDLSPCNTVFRDDVPVAVIDWDGAAVGERWQDLTYVIWLWTNIGSLKRDTETLLTNMKEALTAYGPDRKTISDFPEKLIWRMDRAVCDVPEERWDYQRTRDWVDFSKEWVEENSDEIRFRLSQISCSDEI